MFTVGTSVGFGAGRVGFGPIPASTGKVAISAQADKLISIALAKTRSTVRMEFFLSQQRGVQTVVVNHDLGTEKQYQNARNPIRQ
ncbi:MAG TPA: hypothetical protein VL051_07075 [Burkholderiaceae bacterium]|nr:hypothetical protein [Burkholderiaceae bacterium]